MRSLLYTFVFLLPAFVSATNDWDTPCFNGSCSYDLPEGGSQAGGYVSLNGTAFGISDLTKAAGWEILDCDKNSTAQDIRAIWTGNQTDGAHVYQNGAVDTIVRLPEECGGMPYARVVSEWTHENQTVPDHIARRLARRDGSENAPTVRGITLDVDFAKIDPSRHGAVGFVVQAGKQKATQTSKSSREIEKRMDMGAALRAMQSVLHSAVSALPTAAAGAAASAAADDPSLLGYLKMVAGDMGVSSNNANQHFTNTSTFQMDGNYTLSARTAECLPSIKYEATFQADLVLEVDATVSGTIDYDITMVGTLSPQNITDVTIAATLDVEIDATLMLLAYFGIAVEVDEIEIYYKSLGGIYIPGFLSVGPAFSVSASGSASVQGAAMIGASVGYTINNAKINYPSGTGSSVGTFTAKDGDMLTYYDPRIGGVGEAAVSLIPKMIFGITALGSIVKADVEIQYNATIGADLGLAVSPSRQLAGNIDVWSTLVSGVSANAKFFGLFDSSTEVPLDNKRWDLYNKSFSTKREHVRDFEGASGRLESKRETACGALINGPPAMTVNFGATLPSDLFN